MEKYSKDTNKIEHFIKIEEGSEKTLLKKEQITFLTIENNTISISMESGHIKFIRKNTCENFEEILKILKNMNLERVLKKDGTSIEFFKNKISLVKITKECIYLYIAGNSFSLKFLKEYEEESYNYIIELVKSLEFLEITINEIELKISPIFIESISEENSKITINTVDGEKYKVLKKQIKNF